MSIVYRPSLTSDQIAALMAAAVIGARNFRASIDALPSLEPELSRSLRKAVDDLDAAYAALRGAEPEPDTASSEPATDGGFGTGTGADADYLTRLERRWDRLWSLACRVAHAIERYDAIPEGEYAFAEHDSLLAACRELTRVVDEICPNETEGKS